MTRADRPSLVQLMWSAIMHRSKSAPASMALLAGAAVLALPAPSLAQPAGSATEAGGQADLIFWQSVSDSNDRAQYEAYLAAFPQGLFARLAQAKINATASSQSPAASVPTPPQAIAKAEQPRKQVASRSSVSPALPRSASSDPRWFTDAATRTMDMDQTGSRGTPVLPARLRSSAAAKSAAIISGSRTWLRLCYVSFSAGAPALLTPPPAW